MSIVNLRVSAAYVVSGFALLIGIMGVAVEYFAQGDFGLASLLSVASMATLLFVFVVARQSQAFRYTAVSVMMAEVIALLIASRGYTWQMDMHMAFFAALALCALMYDVRAIILGTVLVAVHHIGLGMTLESLVFYGGGSLYRIGLHAGLLLTAAAGLIWLTLTTQRLLGVAEEQARHAAGETEKVRMLAEATEQERAARNDGHRAMMTELKAEMGGVVEAAGSGDFTRRVEASFADAELNALADGINRLVETVERGLGETGSVLAALADTDLTRRVEGEHEGAFNALKTSTNAVADRMSDIMRTLRQTSGQLKSATGEMLTGANDLSERTRKQATTIQETAAAISQLAQTVQQSAQAAREASSVAGTVSRTADEGGQVMHSATQAMERISDSSAKISNIIGLIDDIAFQTNLLALNASVEAARAGDAGKGFAVVAIEVRRLAQSAAKASSEVKALIEQSAGEVKVGSRFVTDAASKLGAMLEAARTSNALMDGIAQESTQQAAALEEVTDAVRQLDEMTQHNAALVEQTNASIEQTKIQASELDAIVAVFSVEDGERHPASPSQRTGEDRGGAWSERGRTTQAARSYRVDGNAAIDPDWSEF